MDAEDGCEDDGDVDDDDAGEDDDAGSFLSVAALLTADEGTSTKPSFDFDGIFAAEPYVLFEESEGTCIIPCGIDTLADFTSASNARKAP